MPKSLWAETAQKGPSIDSLDRSIKTDVAIVGAGFTGLSTALHLAERGVGVAIVDAGEPGWGASGRNGGQVIPGLKYDPDELLGRFGRQCGESLVDAVGRAADTVFDLIDDYGIACSAVRNGWIQPAHSTQALRGVLHRAAQWRRRGVAVEELDARDVSRRLGSQHYIGGWFDPRAGSIHPLSFARGLACAAIRRSVEVYGSTVVKRLTRRSGGWELQTAEGHSISCSRVVLATDGYTDALWPNLRRSIIAANSYVIATRPLDAVEDPPILPGREVASDSRRLLVYFRRDPEGRLVFGGRGPFREPRSHSDWAHLERAMTQIFPQLRGVEVSHRWAGRVAITQDFLPHVHEPAPGISISLGYNGRGIALAITMGKHLAARLTEEGHAFPFPVTSVKPILFHGLQRVHVAAAVSWYRLLDSFK